jgi:DNA-binding GntR family transcriptional regulator
MLNTEAVERLASKIETDTIGTVTDRTYEGLRAMILAREIEPGMVIEERRLAEMLRVSRTPMRAAMGRLLGEELLTRLSNGALVVKTYTLKEYLELMRVRKILEMEAAALAASAISETELAHLRTLVTDLIGVEDAQRYWVVDDIFHETIASNADNGHLRKLIADNRNQVRMCSVGKVPSRSKATCEEHLAILDALSSRDPAASRQAMGDHLENVQRAFLRTLHGDAEDSDSDLIRKAG